MRIHLDPVIVDEYIMVITAVVSVFLITFSVMHWPGWTWIASLGPFGFGSTWLLSGDVEGRPGDYVIEVNTTGLYVKRVVGNEA